MDKLKQATATTTSTHTECSRINGQPPADIIITLQGTSRVTPKRRYDHRIHLKDPTKPTVVRPYRYPQIQKDELEKTMPQYADTGDHQIQYLPILITSTAC